MPNWVQYKSGFELTRADKNDPRAFEGYPKVWTQREFDRFRPQVEKKYDSRQKMIYSMFEMYQGLGRPTLFCGSKTLAECVERSKLSMDISTIINESPFIYDLDEERFGAFTAGAYSVCWPDTYTINGETLKPVCIGNIDNRVSISLRRGFFLDQVVSASCQDDFDEMLSDKDDIYHTSIKMALRLSILAISCPEQVEDGIPIDMKKKPKKEYMPIHMRSVEMPVEHRNSPSVHYRNAHFRTLEADRYKRDANGLPRVVFVKGSIVGRAKTVKEKL